MKKLLITLMIALFAISVNAQVGGMPRELTCTEEAFTFSASLGTKWKFSAPKMGPVETQKYDPDFIAARAFKTADVTSETRLPIVFERSLNKDNLYRGDSLQKNMQLLLPNNYSFINGFNYFFPINDFSVPVSYNIIQRSSRNSNQWFSH